MGAVSCAVSRGPPAPVCPMPMPQLPPDDSKPLVAFTPPVNLVPGFLFRVETAGAQVVAFCGGVLDREDAAALVQPELMKLHEAIVAARRESVRLELCDVSYMNSNGIKAFASWFLKAEGSREHSYVIDLVYDPGISWQRWSVGALQVLTPRALRLVPRRR